MIQWQAGFQLGPYRLLEPIGAGGMGEVWKAHDDRLDRCVAIKRLKTADAERFRREGRAIAALNHPHICQIYDVGTDYLVMEYVEGEPLKCPLALGEVVRLAIQIAEALEAAHRKGIVHRDLKPGNILVKEGAAKLLDFGLAKREGAAGGGTDFSTQSVSLTEPGVVMGTVAYMSPEQAQGLPVDTRSDIFSLGAVLYEMVSGKQAFTRETLLATLSAVVSDEPPPLQAPDPLQRIVSRCLRKTPAERYPSISEVRAALTGMERGPLAAPQPSVAVLPFADMSPGKDHEYFSDGLAEEVLNCLARTARLKVIARTSAFAFKGQNADVRRIADSLGVTHILEGSVRQAGVRIRVHAQLITAVDGSQIWSERYDRELADVFAVQDEIAQAIASALHLQLGSGVADRYTPNLPAYAAFLKARHYFAKFNPDAFVRCKEFLEQAISLDPSFAAAYGLLGECFLNFAHFGMMPARDAAQLTRANAQRALQLDPTFSEAHAILGVVVGLHDHDWQQAERHFQLAMAREPVPLRVRTWYAHSFLVSIGKARQAAMELESIQNEDPVSVWFHHLFAMCLQRAGQDERAEAEFRRALEIEEMTPPAWIWLGHQYASRGAMDEALACAKKLYAVIPWNTEVIGSLAGLLWRTGDTGRARELLASLGDGSQYGASLAFVNFHLLCGEFDAATDWLEKAIEERHFLSAIYLWSPLAKPLRQGHYWARLAKLMNLPESSAAVTA